MSQSPLRLEGDNIPMVRFANVLKSYGALTVPDHLNLDIDMAAMVTSIGPSGSGKTPVLRVLMTL
jgi:polar amino acid transport system ATP-binding protein